MRKQGGKVLVHCRAGISRSATVCIAYIMWYKHWTMEKAYDYLKSKRSLIAPNLNFMRQLLEFERQLHQSGRCAKSSSTSTHSSSSSYMSTASCDCDSSDVGSQQHQTTDEYNQRTSSSDQYCYNCSSNTGAKASSPSPTTSFSFESHRICRTVGGGVSPPPVLPPTGYHNNTVSTSTSSSSDFINSLVGVPMRHHHPFDNASGSSIQPLQQPPRSASANLFSNSNSRREQQPLPPAPHSPAIESSGSSRPASSSAKPVFNLPLTPCTKQATVFSFDSPICSPLSQHTNSPTMCHSPLVSPS